MRKQTSIFVVLFALATSLFMADVGGPSTVLAQASAHSSFYVSMHGSNTAAGSRKHPFRTIQHAVRAVPSGSRVLVRQGTYSGFEVTKDGIRVAGVRGASVRVEGGATDTVEFKGVRGGGLQHVHVVGSGVQYGSAVRVADSSRVTIRQVQAKNARTYGILVVDSSRVRLRGNDIFGNASGIEERRAVNLRIVRNHIHHNLKQVDSGRGAEGITFFESTGDVLVKGNRFSHNRTHLEVFGASRLNIQHNHFVAGEVMETGTSGPECARNRFVRNIAARGGVSADGMILRCAQKMLIAHNVFDGFDDFAMYIVNGRSGVSFGGSIQGLRVLNNIVVRGRAYSLGEGLPDSVALDYNLLNKAGSTAQYGSFVAYVSGRGNADTLRQFRRWTGYERHGLSASPAFVKRAAGNYHLRRKSPAIDAGTASVGGGYRGKAPDIGRYETR